MASRPSQGKEIYAAELADLLDIDRDISQESRTQKARRWMVDLGIALRHKGKRKWFTTLALLKKTATAEHVWQEAIARGYE